MTWNPRSRNTTATAFVSMFHATLSNSGLTIHSIVGARSSALYSSGFGSWLIRRDGVMALMRTLCGWFRLTKCQRSNCVKDGRIGKPLAQVLRERYARSVPPLMDFGAGRCTGTLPVARSSADSPYGSRRGRATPPRPAPVPCWELPCGGIEDMGRSAGMWSGTTGLQRARDVALPGEQGTLT